MSTDGSTDEAASPYRGPTINTYRVNTVDSLLNADSPLDSGFEGWRRHLGSQYQGKRQLYDVLGYEHPLKIGHHVAKYERGPGVATGLVDKPVDDCWSGQVEVVERKDTNVDETAFEETVREFLDGAYTRLSPIARFRAADRWARLLEFSLLFIGVADENVDEGSPESLANEVATESIDSPEALDYLAVYDQRRVDWEETELVKDPTHPRYRLPETYRVEIADGEFADIHHSRIIHVVEGPGENELKSPEIYRPIFNRLDDMQKLLGGSAEMFWRSAWPGLVLTPPTDENDVPMRFDDDGASVADQIRDYRHNLERLHRVTGDLTKLETDVANPEPQLEVQYQDISSYIDIPMSILRGNETGERATEQDLEMYHEFVAGRRTGHCEEQLLVATIDRLLAWGVFPSTESGDESTNAFEAEWPPQEEQSEQEEAEVASTWAEAFKTMSAGKPNELATPQERRQKLGMDPEYGSEAPDAASPEELAAENLTVPEEADTPENMPEDSTSPSQGSGSTTGDQDQSGTAD